MPVLNDRIKARRIALNLTLQDVADFLGVKEATAQRYESGEIKNIKHEIVASLAELFKCTPAYLMGWSDEISEPSKRSALSSSEMQLLKKFNSLDEKGKHTVNTVLDMEYNRIQKPYLEVVAAHNEDYSEEQIKLMQEDLDDL
ncbi:helix-turn-helix domain-containing protein [Paenibacillus sp. P96]|uniref:Helix-turn-helix domain-containing protein n=1 Tax=Paenibacillus zeirhizosphaerae TaxID=2987519 RepID=A0ABT9FL44_9BACL|nr:helix-turn-helix transcriptional regulator [Paenibacillus sp. P96]MDP4095443.1 helix-turn-helix domain-containing protein [Paenibacillus sp. P96]